MKAILKIFTLKRSYILSALVILLLVIFNFYGPYTGKFYFFKLDNYIFPVLTLVHIVYLYVLWFKIKEDELTDPQMRNLEYALYVISIVYAYKAFESVYILMTYSDYENHLLPTAFLFIGIVLVLLHLLFLGLTLLMFRYRKDRVGNYKFSDMDHIDSWE